MVPLAPGHSGLCRNRTHTGLESILGNFTTGAGGTNSPAFAILGMLLAIPDVRECLPSGGENEFWERQEETRERHREAADY